MMTKNKHIGSDFDDFLAEEGLLEDCTKTAIKKLLALQIADEMEKRDINKNEMAKRMNTSRASLNRLLDPENTSVTLNTMQKAAQILGQRLILKLEPASSGNS